MWMSLLEACKYLKISKETMYRWIKDNKIPYHKAGKLYRFHKDEVDLWLLSL